MPESKPVLIASDVHLGAAPPEHEAAFFEWLDFAAESSSEIIVNGDLFDFWFEYRSGVTRGHDRVLTRLREIVESGLPVTLVGGNHDWWGGRFLTEEVGVRFNHDAITRSIAGFRTYLAHGDGLGAGDHGYHVMKAVLRSPVTRFAFGLLPVGVGDHVASHVSNTKERWDQWGPRQIARSEAMERWAIRTLDEDRELDLVLLGHTHLPMIREVGHGQWYVNSGDWVFHQTWVTLRPGEAPRIDDWRERS
ncbi:MAG: UDP-2,3-diacylglucosamine diphosphatase [Gemmatimonadota bacterium]